MQKKKIILVLITGIIIIFALLSLLLGANLFCSFIVMEFF